MVADVLVRLAPGETAEATEPADPGVRGTNQQMPSGETRLRLRGLEPGHHHEVVVTARDGSGAVRSARLSVDSPPALPGYVVSFPVVTSGAPGADYRLFDLQRFPAVADSAFYVVDARGKTRFYLPVITRLTEKYPVAKVPAGVKLLPDGTLAFLQDHDFFVLDELGRVVSHVPARALGVTSLHHDVIRLPTGSFLAIGLSFREIRYPDEPGPANVGGDSIVEFTADGKKLWSWDSFDHLDPQKRGESFFDSVPDPTRNDAPGYDWMHSNALLYSEADDSILLSVRHLDTLLSIDHRTGKILYRLGPGGDFTLESGTWFVHQHGPEWVPGGILVYDNGNRNPNLADTEERSRAIRLALDVPRRTARVVWETGGEPYMSPVGGNAYSTSAGGVLVLDSFITKNWDSRIGHARAVEYDASGKPVWTLEFSDNRSAYRMVPVTRLPGERAP